MPLGDVRRVRRRSPLRSPTKRVGAERRAPAPAAPRRRAGPYITTGPTPAACSTCRCRNPSGPGPTIAAVVPGDGLDALQRVHGGRERFEKRRALERDVVRKRQQRRRRHHDELREHTGARQPDVVPVLAEVVVAAQAVIAVAAAGDGLDADARARRRPAGARPERDDFARGFMSDDQRRRHRPLASAIDAVVTAADRCRTGPTGRCGPALRLVPAPARGVSSTSRWPAPGAVLIERAHWPASYQPRISMRASVQFRMMLM